MPLKGKAKVGARAAEYFWQFEGYINLVRCQDDILATIEVANFLQAGGSVALVVRTAGDHVET